MSGRRKVLIVIVFHNAPIVLASQISNIMFIKAKTDKYRARLA